MQTISKIIFSRAQQSRSATAFALDGRAISYGMLMTGVGSLTKTIDELGLSISLPVAVQIADPARHIMLALALGLRGYCVAPIADTDRASAIGAQAVICDKANAFAKLPQHVLADAWFQKGADAAWRIAPVAKDVVSRIEFTSGTTGLPKAISLTDDAILRQTQNRIMAYALSERRCLSMFRPSTNVGFGFALACLTQGRTLFYGETNDDFIDIINHHQIECVAGSPAQVNALVSRLILTGRSVTSVRRIVLAGSLPSNDELRRIRATMGGTILVDYGASETGPIAIATDDGLLLHEAGFPLFSTMASLELIDKDGDGYGEVRTRSDGMAVPFKAGSLSQTEESRGDGWFYPGDIGRILDDGRFELAGRKDSRINIGGVKMSLETIEELLRRVPGVLDLGIAATEVGSSSSAIVVAAVASRDISISEMRNAVIARFPDLAVSALVRVSEIPRNAAGKVDRRALLALHKP